MKKFLSVSEMCKATGLSSHYLRNMIKSGKIPHIQSGNKVLINYDLAMIELDQLSINGTNV